MSNSAFDMNEFIRKDENEETPAVADTAGEENPAPELDVQKAVVEELAADKAKLDEDLAAKEDSLAQMKSELAALKGECGALKAKVAELSSALAAEQAKKIDTQERNPNALALLDRDVELPDRLPGETRDHVLDVIRDAREKAEADGRLRIDRFDVSLKYIQLVSYIITTVENDHL